MQLKSILTVGFFLFLWPSIFNIQAKAPIAPQGPHYWCLSGKASVRLNWFPVSGATSYQVRVDSDAPSWNGTCNNPDACLTTTESEITVPITPGKTYDWWVHAVNTDGWSQPAMPGVEFNCTIPIPAGLHYQCLPDNSVMLNWYDTNLAHLYDVSVDAHPSSWDSSCTFPDRCISVTENTTSLSITPDTEYTFWVQAKDTKGNKSTRSETLNIKCNNPFPTPTNILQISTTIGVSPSPTPISSPQPSPSPKPTFLPTPTITIEPPTPTDNPITPKPDCPRRREGDANCDGTITIQDSQCWEKVFTINFLSTENKCRYTNFDETDGTNILDYAIWYVNWEL